MSLLHVEAQLWIHFPPRAGKALSLPLGLLDPRLCWTSPGHVRSWWPWSQTPPLRSGTCQGARHYPGRRGRGGASAQDPSLTWMPPGCTRGPPLQAPALEPLLASPGLGLVPKKRLLHRVGRRGVKTGRAPGVGPAELKPSCTFSDQRPGLPGWWPPHVTQVGPSESLAEGWDRDVSSPCVCWAAEPGRPWRGAGRGAGERGCPR